MRKLSFKIFGVICLVAAFSFSSAKEAESYHKRYRALIDSVYMHSNEDMARQYFTNAAVQWGYEHTRSALKNYDQSCRKGLAIACKKIADIYKNGLKDVQKDRERAETYYALACALGDLRSCG